MRAGLYVHVPFCLTRCGYCDFNAYADLGHLADRYVESLRTEAELTSAEWSGTRFASIYMGGGTPTTLDPRVLGSLIEHLRARFEVLPGAETTAEANPDTVDERSLATLRSIGITRLSLGVQSFDPAVLAALERVHPPESARGAYAAARAAGFDSVSLDLIYGASGEDEASWRRTLSEAVVLGPDHLSCYALTVEPSTPLGRKVALGLTPPPDPDLQADLYDIACGTLEEAGYRHYEVSNWARPGQESVHNLGYWERRPYLGLGAGAHSYRDGRRWWNVRPPGRYIELIGGGRPATGGEERLGPEEDRMEGLLLSLRQAAGAPAERLPAEAAEDLVARGLATMAAGRLSLTDRGMLLANEVVLALAP
jgi:putative oxygen-independent coproporphyrinogen III oxidase